MSVLSDRHFHDEAAAYKFVEARIWPNGPVCPHCGGVERISKMEGKSTRIGTYKCYQCRKPFTVKIGTIFEASHVKLNHWLQAIFLIALSKKGISSNQLHRTLGVTLKTAWFISHRIREAMRDGKVGPLGGNGQIVEVDETYFGSRAEKRTTRTSGAAFIKKGRSGPSNKRAVLGPYRAQRFGSDFPCCVRNQGRRCRAGLGNIDIESMLFTDESRLYPVVGASSIRLANTFVVASIPTPSKAISASSSGACAAPTSIAQKSICTATLRNSTSAIISA